MTATVAPPARAAVTLPPNFFAAVMGTGILAVAATALPWQLPGRRPFALAMWLLAASLLVALTAATLTHWRRHPATARGYHRDPVTVHFYGAVPMAIMTVGTGTLLVGRDVLGSATAVAIAWPLWVVGTVGGLVTAVAVPFRRRYPATEAFGGWLMPVVPPTVSASGGALLVPHTPPGAAREAMLLGCHGLLLAGIVPAGAVIALVVRRWRRHGPLPARLAPTWFIVLGPLGQSVTAACLLAAAGGSRAIALVYGLPVLAVALVWFAVAARLVLRAAGTGLPFSPAWWSFTFPVGTCATGAAGLAKLTGSDALAALAVALFAGLLLAWTTVAIATVRARQTLVAAGPVSRAE